MRKPGSAASRPLVIIDAPASPISPGKGQHLLKRRRADQPVHAGRAQRVHEDRCAPKLVAA